MRSPGPSSPRGRANAPDEDAPWSTHRLPLRELRDYVEAVLVEMVNNWAVKWDARGKPVAQLKAAAEDAKGSWCHYVVDMSAIGMSLDTPLVVHSYEGDNFLTWNLGATPLAHVPKG